MCAQAFNFCSQFKKRFVSVTTFWDFLIEKHYLVSCLLSNLADLFSFFFSFFSIYHIHFIQIFASKFPTLNFYSFNLKIFNKNLNFLIVKSIFSPSPLKTPRKISFHFLLKGFLISNHSSSGIFKPDTICFILKL